MVVPGSNILNTALSVIAKQTVTLYKFVSRETNEIGLDVATYARPVSIQGSFQVVPRRLYQQYGLDLNRNYATFYASTNMLDVTRDVSGDYLIFNGKKWQCDSSNDWFAVDGWVGMLVIEIKDGECGCA